MLHSERIEKNHRESAERATLEPARAERVERSAPLVTSRIKRWGALTSVYLVWGSTFLAIRIGVESLPPFLLGGIRFSLAGGLLYLAARLGGVPAPSAVEWRRAGLAGIVLVGAGNGLVTWAETSVPSNLAALCIAAVPSYVVLFEWLRPGGTQPSRRALIGVCLGAGGMTLLFQPDPAALEATRGWALLCLVLAGAAWALGSLYTRYQKLHASATVSGAQQMLAGGLLMIGISFARGELDSFDPHAVSPHSLLALAYLTAFGSMLAFSAFTWLTKVTTPAGLATTAYVNPVIAVGLGWLVLDEKLPAPALTGAGIILCAVVLMVTPGRRNRT